MLALDRQNTIKTIIVISDGEANEEILAKETAERIKESGIIICSVFISHLTTEIVRSDILVARQSWGKGVMKAISSGEEYFIETDYYNLGNALKEYGLCM